MRMRVSPGSGERVLCALTRSVTHRITVESWDDGLQIIAYE